MKIVGIAGYSKSGKTTLILKLIKEFQKRGKKITVIKHRSCDVNGYGTSINSVEEHSHELMPETYDKDTHKFSNLGVSTLLLSNNEARSVWKQQFTLEELLTHVDTDLVIVEGNKRARNYPRIVCTDGRENPENLFVGLELAQYGVKACNTSDVPLVNDVENLCDIIEASGFKLPDLNCGECGHNTCYEMGKSIVKGEKKIEDCTSLYSDINIWINGEKLPVKKFVQDCLRGTITGFLSSLKGANIHGKVKIEF